jgi:hypothetical protein
MLETWAPSTCCEEYIETRVRRERERARGGGGRKVRSETSVPRDASRSDVPAPLQLKPIQTLRNTVSGSRL